MKLSVLAGEFSILRFAADSALPPGLWSGEFATVSRTADELSVVVETRLVPSGSPAAKIESGFRALKVEGPLDFALTGILAKMAVPLAGAKISIFAISTFDTDYVLVRASDLARTKQVLVKAGFSF